MLNVREAIFFTASAGKLVLRGITKLNYSSSKNAVNRRILIESREVTHLYVFVVSESQPCLHVKQKRKNLLSWYSIIHITVDSQLTFTSFVLGYNEKYINSFQCKHRHNNALIYASTQCFTFLKSSFCLTIENNVSRQCIKSVTHTESGVGKYCMSVSVTNDVQTAPDGLLSFIHAIDLLD